MCTMQGRWALVSAAIAIAVVACGGRLERSDAPGNALSISTGAGSEDADAPAPSAPPASPVSHSQAVAEATASDGGTPSASLADGSSEDVAPPAEGGGGLGVPAAGDCGISSPGIDGCTTPPIDPSTIVGTYSMPPIDENACRPLIGALLQPPDCLALCHVLFFCCKVYASSDERVMVQCATEPECPATTVGPRTCG